MTKPAVDKLFLLLSWFVVCGISQPGCTPVEYSCDLMLEKEGNLNSSSFIYPGRKNSIQSGEFHDWLSYVAISTTTVLDGMGACWFVPNEPKVDKGQILHYWIGMEPSFPYPPPPTNYFLVQPVLQWIAPSRGFPWKGWVMKNEITSCKSDYNSHYTPVNVGEKICGSISLFGPPVEAAYVSTLLPNRVPIKSNICKVSFYPGDMRAAYVVLELTFPGDIYSYPDCSIFPEDPVYFYNVTLRGVSPPYHWTKCILNSFAYCNVIATQTHFPNETDDGRKIEIFTIDSNLPEAVGCKPS